MEVKFKIIDEDGQEYGTFRRRGDAEEHAQEMSNEFEKDMFIEKITIESIKCVIPD